MKTPPRLSARKATATPLCQADAGRSSGPIWASLEAELLSAAATGEDLHAGLTEVATVLRQRSGVAGVEWWRGTGHKSVFHLVLKEGSVGPRTAVPLGAAGALVLVGDVSARLISAVSRVGPVLHHRSIAEQLADEAERLARQNEALEDLVALVAHDVRSSLLSALGGDGPGENKMPALELVDSILEAVRADQSPRGVASVADCVRLAAADLGGVPADLVTSVGGDVPMPHAALRLVLRNLLRNAVAAGAKRIHIWARTLGDRTMLIVDNDGAKLGATECYATGTQLGLALCRRLVARCGGELQLRPRAVRGTRAMLVLSGVCE
ncbi:ATP-binding protein [Kribbella steppae]|nr:ATP-binding protein [Kribbella steppae]